MFILKKEYENLRKEFLNELTESNVKIYKMLFKKVKVYEEEINVPFEEFDEQQSKELATRYLDSKTVNSLSTKVSMLRRYMKFIGNNSMQSITRSELRDAVEKYIGTNDAELKYISWNELINVMENKLEYAIDKAVICLLHLGISGFEFENIRNLKVDDIDFINNQLIIKDKIYKFDNYMKEVFEDAKDELGYEFTNAQSNQQIVYYNQDNPYLIKCRPLPINNNGLNAYSGAGMINKMQKIFKKLDLGITPINVLQNGFAERLAKMEIESNINMIRKDVRVYLKMNGEHVSEYDVYLLKEYIKKGLTNEI